MINICLFVFLILLFISYLSFAIDLTVGFGKLKIIAMNKVILIKFNSNAELRNGANTLSPPSNSPIL